MERAENGKVEQNGRGGARKTNLKLLLYRIYCRHSVDIMAKNPPCSWLFLPLDEVRIILLIRDIVLQNITASAGLKILKLSCKCIPSD